MDVEIIKSEASQAERQTPYDTTYKWNLKYDANGPPMKQTHRQRADRWMPGRAGMGSQV